jgi:UDP-N-acetylglucosamine transferase subunit ALG13
VVSTGAAIATVYLPLAVRRAMAAHYVESAARTAGPSLTGRLLARSRRVHLHTQFESWARRRWSYCGSIFDGFEPADDAHHEDGAAGKVRRVLVTLGTSSFGFERLVHRLETTLAGCDEVIWQIGDANSQPAFGRVVRALAADELAALHHEVDVVVAHAGVGSALTALAEGRAPVLVPRLRQHGENVDDHQLAIADHLTERGLAVAADASSVTLEQLQRAALIRVERRADPPPLHIGING